MEKRAVSEANITRRAYVLGVLFQERFSGGPRGKRSVHKLYLLVPHWQFR